MSFGGRPPLGPAEELNSSPAQTLQTWPCGRVGIKEMRRRGGGREDRRRYGRKGEAELRTHRSFRKLAHMARNTHVTGMTLKQEPYDGTFLLQEIACCR